MSYKTIDLFCGAGGFSLGFERAGFETALAIDKWGPAIDTFNHNRKCPGLLVQKVAYIKDITIHLFSCF